MPLTINSDSGAADSGIRVSVGTVDGSHENLQMLAALLGSEIRTAFQSSLDSAVQHIETLAESGSALLSAQVEEFALSVRDQARKDAEAVTVRLAQLEELRKDMAANYNAFQASYGYLRSQNELQIELSGRGPLKRLWLEIKEWFK